MTLDYKGFKGTRFVMVAIVWAVSTGLLVAGSLTEAAWVNMTIWLVGLYSGSEVGAKVSTAIKK